jgi:choline dehydrogenase-like flavoprotein
MMSHLYSDGLMQQSEDWRFTVLQGSCVGGSTTVNNGVCFRTPDPVLERWNDPSLHDAGIDVSELKASTAAIESFLSVVRQTEPDPNARLNPSGQPFADAAAVAAPKFDVNVVNANIKDCLGSGYCNMGCKWGRKLSMLETALPWAQQQFPGRVKIVAECEVKRIMTLSGKPNRVAGLVARLGDGRVVQVKADKYILAAGAIASSYLMLRSNVGGGLPVGEGFCCNMGAPLTADLGKKIDSYDGLQISHYGGPQDGYVFETWFNPPVAQALNMPGWFDQHFANMRSYDQLMAVGVLVGTRSNGRVGRALTGGPGIHFRPHPEDRQTMARGMKQLAKILFAMNPKPERVMVNTWGRHDEYTSQSAFNRAIDAICDDPDYMNYGTGHPQGGNALSRNPKRGVVDSDFRVHGYQDLYVCDASVFPTSLTVNPQLTVMSLAHYAAPRIGC